MRVMCLAAEAATLQVARANILATRGQSLLKGQSLPRAQASQFEYANETVETTGTTGPSGEFGGPMERPLAA